MKTLLTNWPGLNPIILGRANEGSILVKNEFNSSDCGPVLGRTDQILQFEKRKRFVNTLPHISFINSP